MMAHRAESRSKFIPTAGDPNKFSNVQLTAFLRGCRLKSQVEKLAFEHAQGDCLPVVMSVIHHKTTLADQ